MSSTTHIDSYRIHTSLVKIRMSLHNRNKPYPQDICLSQRTFSVYPKASDFSKGILPTPRTFLWHHIWPLLFICFYRNFLAFCVCSNFSCDHLWQEKEDTMNRNNRPLPIRILTFFFLQYQPQNSNKSDESEVCDTFLHTSLEVSQNQ